MNPDYVLKGRGQITLHQPDWAKFTPNAGSRAATPSTTASSVTGQASSPLPTEATARSAKGAAHKSAQHANAQPQTTNASDDEWPSQRVDKSRMNNFNHSGASKKSVGPDVDTVDYTFEDFLDTINPLHHIPVVNMIYRHVTGDKISGVAQVSGGGLFWGPMGIVTAAIDAIVEQEKGGGVGETIVAGLLGVETSGARDLPSNKIIKDAPTTMLAEAEPGIDADSDATALADAPVAAPAKSARKLATKQPFGGVMGNEQPAPVANIADAKPATKSTPSNDDANDSVAPASGPVRHAPIEADGHKMYSLAGVVRHVGSPATMPPRDMPDPRLKAYGKQSAPMAKADPSELLGIQKPAASVASTLSDDELPATNLPSPGLSAPLTMDAMTPSGNAIPAELIQDMMLMNMQKYQNDLQNGTLRGSGVDIKG